MTKSIWWEVLNAVLGFVFMLFLFVRWMRTENPTYLVVMMLVLIELKVDSIERKMP